MSQGPPLSPLTNIEEHSMARIGYADDSNPDPDFQKLATQIKN